MDVRVEGLVHVYPSGTRAVDGIDLAVLGGQALAIVGHNGSGKTTLARHLNGLLRPTAGHVVVGDEDVARRSVAQLAAWVGLCFQDPDEQVFSASVRAEVMFGPRNLGRSAAERERAGRRALERTGLSADASRNPYDLGLARRKLLAIASVLAMETPIVVLDEPTLGLDAPGVERVQAIVAEMVAEGRTVIATSHDMRFVAESFGRVVVLRAGRVTLDGTPDEVFAEPRWQTLRESHLEPPYAARVGARLGLGPTPTDHDVVARLAERAAAAGDEPESPRA